MANIGGNCGSNRTVMASTGDVMANIGMLWLATEMSWHDCVNTVL